jgi:hypothetical protein
MQRSGFYFHSASSRPSLEPVERPINLYAEANPTTRVHLVAVEIQPIHLIAWCSNTETAIYLKRRHFLENLASKY